jgi:hypothetical protein
METKSWVEIILELSREAENKKKSRKIKNDNQPKQKGVSDSP